MHYVWILLSIIFLATACAPKRSTTPTHINIKLGGLVSVGATSDFNCLAVAIYYPEFANAKTCTHNGQVKAFTEMQGFMPRNSSLNMNVLNGEGRKFIVYGVKTTNGNCPNLQQNIMGDANLSKPFYLGESTGVKIHPVTNESVNITINYQGSNEVISCTGGFNYSSVIAVWDSSLWDSAAVWGP